MQDVVGQGRAEWFDAVIGRLDGTSLKADWPEGYREIVRQYGPGMFRKQERGGQKVEALADELVGRGLLPEGSTGDDLVEKLKTGKGRTLFQEDAFGPAFAEYTGKADEAIEKLLQKKQGHVPGAIYKEGLGEIDVPWGQGGKNGYGLVHIIERRNSQGFDGESFVRALPQFITEGEVVFRREYKNRAYIVNNKSEAVIRLDWNGEKRAWLVTAYPLDTSPEALGGGRTYHQTYEKGKAPPFRFEDVINIDSKTRPVKFNNTPLGSMTQTPEGYAVRLFADANPSTLFHETGHVFLEEMDGAIKNGMADDATRQDFQTLRNWLGAKEGEALDVAAKEKFARGFEQYLREGKAPSRNLEGVFARFKHWLTSVYKDALRLKVEINDDVRAVFDRMIVLEADRKPDFSVAKVDDAPRPFVPQEEVFINKQGLTLEEAEAARIIENQEAMASDVAELADAHNGQKLLEARQEAGLTILECVMALQE